MLAEHIMEHVAARLGIDAAIIRERNFLRAAGALLFFYSFFLLSL